MTIRQRPAMPEQPVVPETEPVASWAGEQPAPTRSYLPWSRHPPDTPQAVSIIGFALGCLFLFGVNQALDLDSWAGRTEQGLWSALRSAPLGAYWACLAIFHMSEYLTTAIYNPAKVHVGCSCRIPFFWPCSSFEDSLLAAQWHAVPHGAPGWHD
jgi:hypothetical protein